MANCLGYEKCAEGIGMDGANEKDFASPLSLPRLKVGDLVHVFEGTGAGLVNGRDVGWFGKVVGMEGETYLVRNRLLNGRGPANRVLGQFLKLQKDFGFQMGSEERVHFRSLSKRTRERLLSSSDEHNNFAAKKAERELKKVKHQKTQDKEAYERRRLQLQERGTTDQMRNKKEYEGNLGYWQLKAEGMTDKLKTMKVHPNPNPLPKPHPHTQPHSKPNPNPDPNLNPNVTGRPPWQVECKS